MTIDDIRAFQQAHNLIRDRHCCSEIVSTATGISAAYFNAVQDARRVYAESIGAFVPLLAGHRFGLNYTYFKVDDTRVYFADLKTRIIGIAPPPAACYRIHLTTTDPEGEAI